MKKILYGAFILILYMVLGIAVLFADKFIIEKFLGDKLDLGDISVNAKNGVTPHIGENGNWWIGENDTGILAEGKNGIDGKDGTDGINGTNGHDGEDGSTPYIKDGNWWIDDIDTGIVAEGKNGSAGTKGEDGETPYILDGTWWIGDYDTGVKAEAKDGTDGVNGTDGEDGIDGSTPYIENGNWYINGTDTGVVAVGKNGKDGKDGVIPYIKNGTWWLSGSDTGIPVSGKNGTDGKDGKDGKDGENGVTPYIFAGTWWIDGVDTGIVAEGKNGTDGKDGNSITAVKIEDGYLYLMFSENDGVWNNIGKISSETIVNANENDLDFYLMPDGTYGVSAGKQLYFDSIEIPEKYNGKAVSAILPNAFSGAVNLKNIEIPSSVTAIYENAFSGCASLSEIKLSKSVEIIGKNAFLGCISLTIMAEASSPGAGWSAEYNPDERVVIFNCDAQTMITPQGIRYKITDDKITVLGYSGSEICLVIPESIGDIPVTDIADFAFSDNINILSVTLPGSLKYIGSEAFSGCVRLAEVYNLTDMNIAVGDGGFGGVARYAKAVHKSLSDESIIDLSYGDFVFTVSGGKYSVIAYIGSSNDLVLPESYLGNTYSVADYSFYGLDSIVSISIGAKISSIGNYSFAECVNVTELYFGASEATVTDGELSCAFIGLGKNTAGVTVTIGNNVNNLPQYIFATASAYADNAPKITSVVFEAGAVCRSIGFSAFLNVRYLESIQIPSTVQKIEEKVFTGCAALNYAAINGVFYAGSSVIQFANPSDNALMLTTEYTNCELSRIA